MQEGESEHGEIATFAPVCGKRRKHFNKTENSHIWLLTFLLIKEKYVWSNKKPPLYAEFSYEFKWYLVSVNIHILNKTNQNNNNKTATWTKSVDRLGHCIFRGVSDF